MRRRVSSVRVRRFVIVNRRGEALANETLPITWSIEQPLVYSTRSLARATLKKLLRVAAFLRGLRVTTYEDWAHGRRLFLNEEN